MAYTQKPGRGNNAKTGYGVPTPFKQEDKYSGFGKDLSKGNAYEKWDTNNPNYKFREYSDRQAKQDSSAVASKAIKFGIGKREAGKMGSEAANAVRTNMGNADLKVTVKTVPGGEEYNQKVKPGINPKTGAKVKVVPPAKQKISKKMSPMKQMETLKKIGNKIYEGGKYLADMAEGKHGSKNYSESDESMRQKNLPSAKNPKTNEVKKEAKKEVKKASPMKQMETIKKIGSKIYEGGKYLADMAEGRHGSANYSGGDESMRQKNIARNKKTEDVKKESKKATPAKMKKC